MKDVEPPENARAQGLRFAFGFLSFQLVQSLSGIEFDGVEFSAPKRMQNILNLGIYLESGRIGDRLPLSPTEAIYHRTVL